MDINEDNKKFQAATYINEDRLQDEKYIKNKLQSKIIFIVVCSVSVAFILAIIGYFVYRHVTGPSLEKMMNYMEEKYDEEFEVVAVNTQIWTATYTEIKVKSAKYPNELISVITYRYEGKRIYEDNYIPILRRNEFNIVYQDLIKEVYKNSKTYVNSVASYITLPEEIDKNTEIEDILSNKDVNILISVYVVDDMSNKEKQMEQLRLKLKEKRWNTIVDIYYVNEILLEQLNFENRKDIISQPGVCDLYGSMILSDNFEISNIEWSEGSE